MTRTPRQPRAIVTVVACLLCAAGGGRSAQEPGAAFVDRTAASGLTFVHVNGATGDLLLPEVIGGGGALFDYDNDGDLDVFAVQSGSLKQGPATTAASRSRLYRNDLDRPGGAVRFADVTDSSRIPPAGYGMGAAAGDIDNDGWIDLYVVALGANHMLRNNRDGTFIDVTAAAGTDDPRWSTGASFFDYNRDGRLDLYVTNYVNFRADMKRSCFSAASMPDYCNPAVYEPVADSLFHNNGNGTFTSIAARAGLTRAAARGLGVLTVDANGDGWTDIYVANDGDPNQLWMNDTGTGRFTDEALLAGVAVNRMGRPQGSMGVDMADVDADGDGELFVTNLDNEGNTLYANVGKGLFEDRTSESGLFALGLTGFGTRFLDYDNDGALDLLIVNGAVRRLAAQIEKGDPYPLRQPSQLFRNSGRGRFADVSRASPALQALQVGRGLATGDLDNDGDTDAIVFNNNGPARVLLNDAGHRRHWLGLRVIDQGSPRDALHARVELVGAGVPRARRVQADGSYAVAHDPRVLFGLGADTAAKTVRVRWSGGRVEEFKGLAVDRYWTLEPGKRPR